MNNYDPEDETITRRLALRLGFASLGALAAGTLLLRAGASPTEPSGSLGDYARYASQRV